MIIEFIGLPGSGKTTMSTEAIGRIRSDTIIVHTRKAALADEEPALVRHLVRAQYVLGSALRRPKLFVEALRLIRTDRQPNFRTFAKVCWNMWCILGWYGWLSRNATGLAVVDQGLLQAIWSVRLTALDDKADWSGFLQRLELIDGFVIVECDQATLRRRLNARVNQLTRLSRVPDNGLLWWAGQRAFEKACVEAKSLAPVLRITNTHDESLAEKSNAIADWIGRTLDQLSCE